MRRSWAAVGMVVATLLAVGAAGWRWRAMERARAAHAHATDAGSRHAVQLYWFIPDGFRAEPVTMKIYEWARAGLLPNIRWMMENGAYGYSIPVFPGHTPTNTATLVTGALPTVHGIVDGAIHEEGYPVRLASRNGFSSVAKKVPPMWYTLDDQGRQVALISMPGSTPPEISSGIVVRGRWGGWGLDFPAVIFQTDPDDKLKNEEGLDHRLFSSGPELTHFLATGKPSGWEGELPRSFSEPQEAVLEQWGTRVYAYIYDSTDDGHVNYDRVRLSFDKRNVLADLKVGEWSGWKDYPLAYESRNDYNIETPKIPGWERALSTVRLQSHVNIRVIRLGEKGSLRIRFFYDNLNEYLVQPSSLNGELHQALGPMVDFVDSYPPQLVYFPEDRQAFIEEADQSLEWHRKMVAYLAHETGSQVVIHGIYTPNQMLTSRWWMPYLDPKSARYATISEAEREGLWREVRHMYQKIDDILGEIIRQAGPDTYIVLSSDHGAIPLEKEFLVNNLLARHGLLKFKVDPASGESFVDWPHTQAVFLQMDNVYINPAGLAGDYRIPRGPAYEALKRRVWNVLKEVRDAQGVWPFAQILDRADANQLGLPPERVGDLVVAFHAGYSGVERTTRDLEIFKSSLKGGYKQGVIPESVQGMWTPFMIAGPRVKKGYALPKPIRHIDQYPTIFKLLGLESPSFVQGRALDELMGR